MRAPLAAQYPRPAEFEAVRVLLAVQFTWSAILLPGLGRAWETAIAVAASAWIMLQIAAALAAWPLVDVLPSGGFVTLWLACLAVWGHALPPGRWRAIASAIASTFATGGVLVWYLATDLAARPADAIGSAFGPLLIALAAPSHPAVGGWLLLAALLAGGLIAWGAIQPRLNPSSSG